MSQTRDEINDFLMGAGGKAFPFETIGDSVTGVITELKKQQQTDLETGEPLFWANGDPRMMLVVTLATELQDDDDDDGIRRVFLRGGNYVASTGKGAASLVAVKDAVKRSGAPIEMGGTLTLAYSGNSKPAAKGMNAAKLYSASYTPPSANVDLEEMV